MIDFIILMIAAFGAGVLNTIAGGGTFLTLPALVFTGVPPVAANATSAIAVFPGYLAGALGFHRELKEYERWRLARLVAITLLGSLAGSGLLLISSNETFSIIVPFLLLAATLTFLFGERIRVWAASKSGAVRPEGPVGLFAVSVYGGYFNGGLGIVLLALFSLWGMTDIHRMNGLKNALSFALSAISVIVFSAAGIVQWPQAIVMMIASSIGGYIGAPIARTIPRQVLVGIVATIGFGMSLIFLVRLAG
jgi:hypothetical protein